MPASQTYPRKNIWLTFASAKHIPVKIVIEKINYEEIITE